jgi:Fur family ferric uptake transcriptional regulator
MAAAAKAPEGLAPGWQARLRSRGHRLTPQRQLVLEAVARLGHATPEDIVTEVRRTASAVNISTVYRTLDLLEELDLVSHAHLRHGPPTYHATDQAPRHVHLVCSGCDTIVEVAPEALDEVVARLRDSHGFAVDVDHVALSGRCADCVAARRG